jgi:hypothetical protein
MNRHATVRRQIAGELNALVDRALARPERARLQALLTAVSPSAVLIERVRRRAAALARREGPRALAARDRITRVLYAARLRPGWHVAWADASVLEKRASGIGGLVADRDGRVIARVRRAADRLAPFEAEIVAAAALAAAAAGRGVTHLRLYSDCRALTELWSRRRNDPRLDPLRAAAHRLERLELCPLPRLHNQPANRLARTAAFRAAGLTGYPAARSD